MDFDPTETSYGEVLALIWDSHHPLRGSISRQYRNVIWYHNDDQKMLAETSRQAIADSFKVQVPEIRTTLEPLGEFTYAEDYHQKYILRQQKKIIGKLEQLFTDYYAFTDSAVMTQLNGWFGNPAGGKADKFSEKILTFSLPTDVEQAVVREIYS